ncbi:MAG: DUF2189 domain-containing protein, partial [Rhodospirillales bacterium]
GRAVGEADAPSAGPLAVGRIALADLTDALRRGLDDFAAYRSDVIFLCIVYPAVGLVLARAAFDYDMLPLLFPLASGFALVGPFAAIGLYEMSRRRELGHAVAWPDAIGVARSPAFGRVVVLGLLLVAVYFVWLTTAMTIYNLTLGPKPPESALAFARDVLTTPPGWAMAATGMGAGFLFALAVLSISVAFPLLLDRDVSLRAAIGASLRAAAANPGPIAAWGLIVALALALGSLPLFLGLIVVMPVLGHATWHLYRKLLPR